MKNFMFGAIEFYHPEEIQNNDVDSFMGHPKKVIKGERRFVLNMKGENVFVILKGEFIAYSSIRVFQYYEEMLKKYERRLRIEEVSRLFYIMDDNSARTIADATGYSVHQVSWVIRQALLPKDEIYP